MIKMKDYNSISTYDKNNNLVSYIEFAKYLQVPKCFYSVKGNVVNRIHVNEYYSDNLPVYESVNSVIQFDDNIMLSPLSINGEISMQLIKSASTYTGIYPNVVDRLDTYQEFNTNNIEFENFRLKSNLIDDCLNRL